MSSSTFRMFRYHNIRYSLVGHHQPTDCTDITIYRYPLVCHNQPTECLDINIRYSLVGHRQPTDCSDITPLDILL